MSHSLTLIGSRLGMGLRRLSGWLPLPWCIAGGGGAVVWLYLSYLFWLDAAAGLGRSPDKGQVAGLVLVTGLPFVLVGLGAGFVGHAGTRGIRRQRTVARFVFGALEIMLGTLIWLAAAVIVFWWIGLMAFS